MCQWEENKGIVMISKMSHNTVQNKIDHKFTTALQQKYFCFGICKNVLCIAHIM